MKRIAQILELKDDDALFEFFKTSLESRGITQWDYYVNWNKVFLYSEGIEIELNILNYLIGKNNIQEELTSLILKYPNIINAIPILLALRCKKNADKQVNILVDPLNGKYEHFDLSITTPNREQAESIATFFVNTGLGKLLKEEKVKNLVDYVTGVEVGLDSNGRKNRGGHQMENLVERYVIQICEELGLIYLKEANAQKIKDKWNVEVKIGKSSRRIDFVINKEGKLFFIEVNFYNGGGSKLKSTATEYVRMDASWNEQGIEFIWITDGLGWKTAWNPLREYFDRAEYLLNIEMLNRGVLKKIIEQY